MDCSEEYVQFYCDVCPADLQYVLHTLCLLVCSVTLLICAAVLTITSHCYEMANSSLQLCVEVNTESQY